MATASKPLGAYSPMRVIPLGVAKIVFLSGITSSGQAPYDMAAQARIIFERMRELLASEGGDLSHLVKITTFLTEMREYDLYNGVRNEMFAGINPPPASATVGTTQLVRADAKIEIEGVAIIPGA